MNVLLIVPKYVVIPIGIAYIYTVLKQAGHIVDSFIFDNNCDALSALLTRKKYDFAATGGMSVEYNRLKMISDVVKKFDVTFIVGGGIITSEPELLSRALNADYGIIGEGEDTIIELLSCIRDKGVLSSVNGIGYFNNGEFILTEPRKPIDNLDALPIPDYEAIGFVQYLETMKPSTLCYLDIFDYPREYPILTSRSCPYLCTFCYHPIGNKYRQRSIDSIMAEIEASIPKYKINIVSMYDELFSHDARRVYEFCKRFKEFSKTLSWKVIWGCQMRVDGLKDGLLDEMRNAGCYNVSYGFESYSPVVLKSMKKYILPEQIHHALHTTLEKGLSLQANFIFGDRAETLQTAKTTLDFWKEHPEPSLAFIVPAPKSEMYQYAVEKGLIKDKIDFMANHLTVANYKIQETINMTDMSETDFSNLKILRDQYYDAYEPFSIPLKLTDSSITIRCPHCKKITEYNNFDTDTSSIQRYHCRKCRRRFDSFNKIYLRSASPLINRLYLLLYFTLIFLFTEKFMVLMIRKRKKRYMYPVRKGLRAIKHLIENISNFKSKKGDGSILLA